MQDIDSDSVIKNRSHTLSEIFIVLDGSRACEMCPDELTDSGDNQWLHTIHRQRVETCVFSADPCRDRRKEAKHSPLDCEFSLKRYAFDSTASWLRCFRQTSVYVKSSTGIMYIKRPAEHDRQADSHKPDDRRNIKRRHLIFYLRVWEVDADRPLGHVVDITSGGMMLISEQPIPIDQTYTLELRLPPTEEVPKPMRFRAVCRWSDNDINPDFYDTGFEFLRQEPENIEAIRNLIEDYGFRD